MTGHPQVELCGAAGWAPPVPLLNRPSSVTTSNRDQHAGLCSRRVLCCGTSPRMPAVPSTHAHPKPSKGASPPAGRGQVHRRPPTVAPRCSVGSQRGSSSQLEPPRGPALPSSRPPQSVVMRRPGGGRGMERFTAPVPKPPSGSVYSVTDGQGWDLPWSPPRARALPAPGNVLSPADPNIASPCTPSTRPGTQLWGKPGTGRCPAWSSGASELLPHYGLCRSWGPLVAVQELTF